VRVGGVMLSFLMDHEQSAERAQSAPSRRRKKLGLTLKTLGAVAAAAKPIHRSASEAKDLLADAPRKGFYIDDDADSDDLGGFSDFGSESDFGAASFVSHGRASRGASLLSHDASYAPSLSRLGKSMLVDAASLTGSLRSPKPVASVRSVSSASSHVSKDESKSSRSESKSTRPSMDVTPSRRDLYSKIRSSSFRLSGLPEDPRIMMAKCVHGLDGAVWCVVMCKQALFADLMMSLRS